MKILQQTLIAFSFIGALTIAPASFAGRDCSCRYTGGEVSEGQTACIKTHKGMTLARCERVQNNTSWKMLEQPCPTS